MATNFRNLRVIRSVICRIRERCELIEFINISSADLQNICVFLLEIYRISAFFLEIYRISAFFFWRFTEYLRFLLEIYRIFAFSVRGLQDTGMCFSVGDLQNIHNMCESI